MEAKICEKIKENIRHLDKEIEFQKIHAKNHLS